MIKDLQNCDSLKIRYKELQLKVDTYSEAVVLLTQKNDTLDKREQLNNFKIQELNTELKSVKSKKGISVLEGILIGVAALSLGLAI